MMDKTQPENGFTPTAREVAVVYVLILGIAIAALVMHLS